MIRWYTNTNRDVVTKGDEHDNMKGFFYEFWSWIRSTQIVQYQSGIDQPWIVYPRTIGDAPLAWGVLNALTLMYDAEIPGSTVHVMTASGTQFEELFVCTGLALIILPDTRP